MSSITSRTSSQRPSAARYLVQASWSTSRISAPGPIPAERPGKARPIVQATASTISPSSSGGTISATDLRSFSRASFAGSSSRISASAPATSASGRYVIPSPYGTHRPTRTRASPRPFTNSETSRLFPTPACPNTVTSWGERSRATRAAASRSKASSSSRPITRAEESARARLRGLASSALQTWTGSALPFARSSRWSPYEISLCVARIVRSPTSTSPGTASCSNRAATLTASPVTMSSPRAIASRPATTSPVLTPIRRPTSLSCRAPTRSANDGKASRIASAARTARSASSSCACGTPKTARIASPMNFSVTPPCRSTSPLTSPKSSRLENPQLLGIEPFAESRRAGEIGEQDRDDAPLLSDRPER